MIDLSQHGYSHEEILEWLYAPNSIFYSSYRLYALRERSFYKELYASSIHIECKKQDSVKYGGTFSFMHDGDLNWGTDRLQACMTYEHDGRAFEWPLSPPMRVVKADKEITQSGTIVNAESYDESSFLKSSSLGEPFFRPRGTPYLSVIEDIFALAGFRDYRIEPSDLILRTDYEIDEGTALLTIINTLLEEMNYISLEPDRTGILLSRPYDAPYNRSPEIHYYSGVRSIIQEPIREITETRDKHNVFIGYYTNPDSGEQWREVVPNDFPSSALSITNQGYTITAPPKRYDNVASREILYDLVQKEMEEESLSYIQYEIPSMVMPHHGVGDIISFDNELISGTFEEINWTIGVSQSEGGSQQNMSHRVRGLYSA